MLLLPLATALLLATPSAAAACLAVAFLGAFLANEPLLVLTGARGTRARRDGARAAIRRGLLLGAITALAAALAVALAPTDALLALIPAAALGLGVFGLAQAGWEKSVAGELLVCLALPATLPPLVLASGGHLRVAVGAALVWSLSFCLQTLAVHAIKARAPRPRAPGWTVPASLGLAAVVGAALGAALVGNLASPLELLALAPSVLGVVALAALRVTPRHLKPVGWTFAGVGMAVLGMLVAAAWTA